MRRITLFIFAFTLLSSVALSQNIPTFSDIDLKTYGFTSLGEWDTVIHYGKLGLTNNIDYFYLRLRMGEAYYYKQNYLSAITHFEKAIKFNSSDTTAKTFLYYSYLFSGRANDLKLLGYVPSGDENKIRHIKMNNLLQSLYFETGPVLNSNVKKNGNIIGNADLAGNTYYAQLGFNIALAKRVSLYAGVSYITENNLKIIQMQEHREGRNVEVTDTTITHPPQMGHPPFTSHDTIYKYLHIKTIDTNMRFNYNLKQMDYYLRANLHLAKGFDIVPFLHLLHVSTTVYKVRNTGPRYTSHDTIILHTQIPKPPSSSRDTVIYQYPTQDTHIDHYTLTPADTSFLNYSLGLSINKSWGRVSTTLFVTFSNLNNKKQNEIGASLTWYPKGNLNLYFTTTLTSLREDSSGSFVFNQLAGFKTFKNIWLESFVTFGKLNDYTEGDGFIVNNNPGTISFRFGLSPVIVLKHLDISIHYQYQSVVEQYTTHVSNSNSTQNFKYFNNLIIAGIKWKVNSSNKYNKNKQVNNLPLN